MPVLEMLLAATVAAGPAPGPETEEAPAPSTADEEAGETGETGEESGLEESKDPAAARERRFMIGLEAVGLQAPALDTPIVDIDPRFVGETVAMGGLGAFGRWRIVPLVAIDLGVRSGSVRYRDDRGGPETLISQDLLLAEAGLDLFVARGDVGHLGLEAGGGGMYNRIRYELGEDSERSTQSFGSGFVRAGVGAELLTRRVAFVFSLRVYGVMTDRDSAKNEGPAFDGLPNRSKRAAVPALQTFVVGSLGVAYRF